MEQILITEKIREKGYIYFVKEVNGKLAIFRAKAGRRKKQTTEFTETGQSSSTTQ